MPTDTRGDYPLKALLIGGPSHLKRLNFEEGTADYTVTETSTTTGKGYDLPVPAGSGFFESKYKISSVVDESGCTLFLHESVTLPGIHRLPKAAEQARGSIRTLQNELSIERSSRKSSEALAQEHEETIVYLEAERDRTDRLVTAAKTVLEEIVPS